MPKYSIAILEFAYNKNFPVSSAIYGQHNQGTCKLSFSYAPIRGEGRIALVDVGFDCASHGKVLADAFGIQNWHSHAAGLAEVGLNPDDITDLLITHAHFDHIGALQLFPNATAYLQQSEIETWVWAMGLDQKLSWIMSATDPADIMRAVEMARTGRLVVLDGAREDVPPGIDAFPAFDTHTAGSQYVLIRNDGSTPYNMPVGYGQGSQTNSLFSTDEMVTRVAGETRRVIPMHESRLKDLFPSRLTANDLEIVEIAVGDGQLSLVG